MRRHRRLVTWTGIAGSVVGLGAIAVAAALSPTFSLTASAVSDLGAADAANPWLLNGGLIAAAFVGLPFAGVLWATARDALERLGAVAFWSSLAALVLVGLYPTGTAPHAPAAITYFVLFTFGMWLHGSGAALAGDVRRGLAAIWLGIIHVLAWLVWAAVGPDGLALPELVGSLLLLAWVGLTTRWVQRSSRWARG